MIHSDWSLPNRLCSEGEAVLHITSVILRLDRSEKQDDAHHRFHRSGTMQINWFWLAVWLIPYSIKRLNTKDTQILSVRALSWRLIIRWKHGKYSWDIAIPLFSHLKEL
jgi:hypothetical protein